MRVEGEVLSANTTKPWCSPTRVIVEGSTATAAPAEYHRFPPRSMKIALTPRGVEPTRTREGRLGPGPEVLVASGSPPGDPTLATAAVARESGRSALPISVGGAAACAMLSKPSRWAAVGKDGVILPAVP